MSRTGISNTLIAEGVKERNTDIDTSSQLSMFDIWDHNDDTHETTYQLISPEGDIFDLTFSTNDPRAFDNWCVEEGLNPEKIHAIAREGLNSAYKDWFVKLIDTPVEIPEEEPEPIVVKAAPKKPRKKRRTKAQIAADKVAKEKKDVGDSVGKGAGTTKPKKKRRTKAQIEADKVKKATEEKVKNDDGWDEIELKVIDENKDAMRPAAFKQSAETIPMNRKQRRAEKKRKKK